MGDMADAAVDGECCQVCGEFFETPFGYPVTCKGCGGDADEDMIGEEVKQGP